MKKLDLTQGNVPGVLFQFALPYLLANMLQALYGGADLFVWDSLTTQQAWPESPSAAR